MVVVVVVAVVVVVVVLFMMHACLVWNETISWSDVTERSTNLLQKGSGFDWSDSNFDPIPWFSRKTVGEMRMGGECERQGWRVTAVRRLPFLPSCHISQHT